jgi:hypothetical protein
MNEIVCREPRRPAGRPAASSSCRTVLHATRSPLPRLTSDRARPTLASIAARASSKIQRVSNRDGECDGSSGNPNTMMNCTLTLPEEVELEKIPPSLLESRQVLVVLLSSLSSLPASTSLSQSTCAAHLSRGARTKRESCPSFNESKFVWGHRTCSILVDRREAKAGLRPCDRAGESLLSLTCAELSCVAIHEVRTRSYVRSECAVLKVDVGTITCYGCFWRTSQSNSGLARRAQKLKFHK